VRCGQDRCEQPAIFLFVAARFSDGLWAYCEEHAQLRVRQERLELPKGIAATAGSWRFQDGPTRSRFHGPYNDYCGSMLRFGDRPHAHVRPPRETLGPYLRSGESMGAVPISKSTQRPSKRTRCDVVASLQYGQSGLNSDASGQLGD
jgi:hypothetical protein